VSAEDDFRLQDEARELLIEAAQKAVDTHLRSAGGVITGYVLVVESVGAGGQPSLTWVSGNGMPTGQGEGGLGRWRAIGMLMDVVTQAQASIWRWKLRGEPDPPDL
jgi:hypothetical protein